MRKITEERTLYKFDELPEKVQTRLIEQMSESLSYGYDSHDMNDCNVNAVLSQHGYTVDDWQQDRYNLIPRGVDINYPVVLARLYSNANRSNTCGRSLLNNYKSYNITVDSDCDCTLDLDGNSGDPTDVELEIFNSFCEDIRDDLKRILTKLSRSIDEDYEEYTSYDNAKRCIIDEDYEYYEDGSIYKG